MKFLAAVLTLIAAPVLAGEGAVFEAPQTFPVGFEIPADGPLEFRGAVVIRPPISDFGGISGLAMLDPRTALAITDRGDWVEMALKMEEGRLTGVDRISMRPVVDANGARVEGGARDAEDLTRDPETGQIWVSFEADHRIWEVLRPGGAPVSALRRREWGLWPANTGLEALARDAEGRLWAIREASGEVGAPFPVYVWDGETWDLKRLPRSAPHLVTGAAFGPDGWLYVTQRDFSFTRGFDFQLRRFRWGDGETPEVEETLLTLPASSGIDNIEGVALWEEEGEVRLLLASDDNMFILQRNILALFALRR